MLDPIVACLTPEVSRKITQAQVPPDIQIELESLAERSTEGTLTEPERRRYLSHVQMINFITLLQAKARTMLDARQYEDV